MKTMSYCWSYWNSMSYWMRMKSYLTNLMKRNLTMKSCYYCWNSKMKSLSYWNCCCWMKKNCCLKMTSLS
jgi:hypothetical protein